MSQERSTSKSERTHLPVMAADADDPSRFPGEASRRDFLVRASAGLALAGVGACARAPSERLTPYTTQPPEVTPGVAAYYATSLVLDGYATGVVVKSREGRPVKVEGNPDHPASLGATDAVMQAAIADLYDPARLRAPRKGGLPAPWGTFRRELDDALARRRGEGVHFLTRPTGSPFGVDRRARIAARYPGATFHVHAPLARDAIWAGTAIAFGRPLEPRLDVGAADVIVALDADFLAAGPGALRHARAFADRRRVRSTADRMNRLYVVEPSVSVTGSNADHRIAAGGGGVGEIAAALLGEVAAAIGAGGAGGGAAAGGAYGAFGARDLGADAARIRTIAADLVARRGAGLVVAGAGQPAEVHAIAAAINALLGNAGKTVTYAAPPIDRAGATAGDLGALARALDAGTVDTLVILDANPVYDAPGELDFAARLRRARFTACLASHATETVLACTWGLPLAHDLEAWGDGRAFDGTAGIVQPLVQGLGDVRSEVDVLSMVAGDGDRPTRDLVRDYWRAARGAGAGAGFDAFWTTSLARGVIDGTASPAVDVALRPDAVAAAARALLAANVHTNANAPRATGSAGGSAAAAAAADASAIALHFVPDPRVHDGRFANVSWLLELPHPVHKLTWENAAEIAPSTARALGVDDGDALEIARAGRAVTARVRVVPGVADGAVAIALGWGRTGDLPLARGGGTDAFVLRPADAASWAPARATKSAAPRVRMAITQGHFDLAGRDDEIARRSTLDDFRRAGRLGEAPETPKALYHVVPDAKRQWAMAIDMNACTGCSACVVACQAENNVPVVGRAGVLKGREMHWLRIDRYSGRNPAESPVSQPMLCQHCESAPCEYVCPTNATVHSSDGLNQMVYNRCVGTRFCSNNCPYKVRRFNWFDYHQHDTDLDALAKNPDVTVRERGVMEKCTFCVQRIREAEIRASVTGAPLGDGAVRTACEQACPTRAIVFGDRALPGARVAELQGSPRAYAALGELGTVPRVAYLGKLTNPNGAFE